MRLARFSITDICIHEIEENSFCFVIYSFNLFNTLHGVSCYRLHVQSSPTSQAGLETKVATIEMKLLPAVAKEPVKYILSKNGITVKGVTTHAVNRAIEKGVKTADILDALKNPLKVAKVVKDSQGRDCQRLVGSKAEVAVSWSAAKVVSVNPTSTKKARKLAKASTTE